MWIAILCRLIGLRPFRVHQIDIIPLHIGSFPSPAGYKDKEVKQIALHLIQAVRRIDGLPQLGKLL